MRTSSHLKATYNLSAIACLLLLLSAALLTLAVGCEKDRSLETDAELGLSFQQATGRRVFETYCTLCHYAYSSSGLKGPGLKNLFGKSFLPSGLPAND